jgi:hypothetical protein
MNIRTITSLILAVTLAAPVSAVFGAEQSGRWPYTGPNTPVLTTAANTADRELVSTMPALASIEGAALSA